MTRRVAVQLVGTFALIALGLWVAALVVTDFVVAGRWLPSLLVTAVVLTAMVGLVTAGVSAVVRAARRADGTDRGEGHAGRLPTAGWVLVVLAWLAAPLLLWLSVRISAALGLPVSLTGFWPTVLTGLVILVVRRAVAELVRVVLRHRRPGVLVITGLPVVLCVGVLWLADVVFDGVRLGSGPEWQRWLTLVVLAAVMAVMASAVDVRGPGMSIVLVGAVWLLLWLLTSLSTLLDVTLSVSGFWAFAVTAIALSVATWPGRLAHANANQPTGPDPFFDDPLPGARF
ncbi:hypothetical protein [Actinophytocola gossypii]|uniref:Uncharacterized protein n=1 Tax=Actinophytocola gossypii TaxID=2812003 RepID=A0ABT2J7N8_9PSEU|nr:hypothetical protein [Actinophytocola gossypii]MCT2583858.1 hypothetical protein [Actinophytocola gossypii]